jgi:anaerobic selenocysteine-containing dehydrogenase
VRPCASCTKVPIASAGHCAAPRTAGKRSLGTRRCAKAPERIGELQREHGRDALAFYIGNPTGHNHGAMTMVVPFAGSLGTRNSFDVNSLDANPRLLACHLMYGDFTTLPIPDLDLTEYMLMLGANPAASNGSAMTLGDVRRRFSQLRKRGGRLVLIDPRRTETAAWADEHHFIRPGGDVVRMYRPKIWFASLFVPEVPSADAFEEQRSGSALGPPRVRRNWAVGVIE